jgi:hypothetical protein
LPPSMRSTVTVILWASKSSSPKSGVPAGAVPHARGSVGAEGTRLALDILEGQNFARRMWRLLRRAAIAIGYVVAALLSALLAVHGLALVGAYDLDLFRPSRVRGTTAGDLGIAPDPRAGVVTFSGRDAITTLPGHDAPIVSADPMLGGSAILTSAADGSVRLTRTRSTEILYKTTAPGLSSAAHDRLWEPYGALPASWAMDLEGQARQMAERAFRPMVDARTWEQIGCNTFDTDPNHGAFKVAGGEAFDAVRLDVYDSDIYVRSIRVRYITGSPEYHELNWMVRKSSQTNAVGLQTSGRAVRQLELNIQRMVSANGVVKICFERSAAIVLFDNWNKQAVFNNPTVPTQFTITQDYFLTYIANYHWNEGKGIARGDISLRDQNGKLYGPWRAITSSGQGEKQNVNWECKPSVRIPAGTYIVIDSDVASWSQNEKSGRRGISLVKGYPATREDCAGLPCDHRGAQNEVLH